MLFVVAAELNTNNKKVFVVEVGPKKNMNVFVVVIGLKANRECFCC